MTTRAKVSQRRRIPISHPPRGRGLRIRVEKLLANQTFRNSLACRFHQFLSEHVGSCTLFPRLVTLSSLGMLQVRWQTDAREVEVPPPHRRLFGRNGFIEPWMCLFGSDAGDADHLLIEQTHRENLGMLAAALANKHARAARRPRAGSRRRRQLQLGNADRAITSDPDAPTAPSPDSRTPLPRPREALRAVRL